MVQVFIYAFVYLILWLIFRKMLIEAKANLGIGRRTAKHYTIMLENLPIVAEFNEQEFLERTLQNRREKIEVAQTSFTYDISTFYEKYAEYLDTIETVTHIECYRRTLQFRAERDHVRIDELEMNKKYPFHFPLCCVRGERRLLVRSGVLGGRQAKDRRPGQGDQRVQGDDQKPDQTGSLGLHHLPQSRGLLQLPARHGDQHARTRLRLVPAALRPLPHLRLPRPRA
jgi:hypothetical protein